jgi:WD40 repeat protein
MIRFLAGVLACTFVSIAFLKAESFSGEREATAGPAVASRSPLNGSDVQALWNDLASRDAARAYRAMQRLAEHPEAAVRLLGDKLRPAPQVETQRITKLLTDLDSGSFKVRQQAGRELEDLGDLARAHLLQTQTEPASLEVQRRAAKLLVKFSMPVASAELLRSLRAVEVLEDIGGPSARQVLSRLAQGSSDHRLTEEAKLALQRLDGRAASASPAKPQAAPPAAQAGRLGSVRFRHDTNVTALVFSADGATLATVDGTAVRFWDRATDRQRRAIPYASPMQLMAAEGNQLFWVEPGPKARLADLSTGQEPRVVDLTLKEGDPKLDWTVAALAPDSKLAALAGTVPDGKAFVHLFDLATGKSLRRWAFPKMLLDIAFSPDGRQLALTPQQSPIEVWDVAAERMIRKLQTAEGNHFLKAVFSADGRMLFALTQGGRGVRRWDIASGKEQAALAADEENLAGLIRSSDGQLLAITCSTQLVVLDPVTGREKSRIPLPGFVSSLPTVPPSWRMAFSPDNRLLASAGFGPVPVFWELDNGTEANALEGHRHFPMALAFSPDGKKLASMGADEKVFLWDVAAAKAVRRFDRSPLQTFTDRSQGSPGQPLLAFTGNGRFLNAFWEDDRVWVWDRKTDRTYERGPRQISDGENSVLQVPPPGSACLSPATMHPFGPVIGRFENGEAIVLREAITGRELRRLDWSGPPKSGGEHMLATPPTLALSANGKYLVSWGFRPRKAADEAANPVLRVWEVTTGQERQPAYATPWVGSERAVLTTSSCMRGARRIGHFQQFGGFGGSYGWGGAFGRFGGGAGGVFGNSGFCGFQGNGFGGNLGAFGIMGGPGAPFAQVSAAAFCPAGKHLLLASHESISLWNFRYGKLIRQFASPGTLAETATFSSDGKLLAALTIGGTVRFWEVATGTNLGELKGPDGGFACFALSPDGRTLAGGCWDTTIWLGDISRFRPKDRGGGS